MRQLLFAALLALCLLGLVASASAQSLSSSVICNGSICGGTSNWAYEYQVSVSQGLIFGYLGVGTCDGDISHYTNVVTPDHWTFAIMSGALDHSVFTEHGTVSSQTGQCPYILTWTADSGYELNNFVFSYNNPYAPHDALWEVSGASGTDLATWDAQVGMGSGPVHSPTVPEPGSIVALGSGIFALIGTTLRKRR